jgi:uncharacterized protein
MNPAELNRKEIGELCQKHRVAELYLFGSATRDDFSPASDVDFAVRFDRKGFEGSFDQYFDFKEALERTTGRRVDLVCLPAIQNHYFLRELQATRTLVYAAA